MKRMIELIWERMAGIAPTTTPAEIVKKSARDLRRRKRARRIRAIIVPAAGATARTINPKKKPLISVTIKAATAERTAATINPTTKSYQTAVSNFF
jgi:hypothetical protein